jgi:tetratricopeptide (TPR) repeat protein
METLKKLKTVFLISALVITITGHSTAQDYKAIQDAFATSYTNEKAGEYAKGVEALKKVYDESSYEINLRLGWLTYESGLFTESIAFYQKAIALMPYAIEPKFGMTYPAAALGNWDQVSTQYNEVLKIDPNNTIANYKLGYIYYGKEDFTTAYKYFEKVVNLYPFDYDSVIMFAWTNFKLGKLREAKVLFNKALMLSPDDKSATEGLGLIK